MALILCIETGTDVCSVGLSRDGEIVSLRESDEGRDHARKVAVFVDELLRETGITPSELDAVAVGKGPGSYTGLRIGVSFAKGLCYALRIPLIAVSSMEALAKVALEEVEAGALNADDFKGALLCPMVDARRMEVYTQIFDENMNPLTEVMAEIVTGESFSEVRAGRRLVIFGSGAGKCTEVLDNVCFAQVTPSVRGMGELAQKAFDASLFEDVAYFEPFYLKDFVVTASRKKLF